VELPISEAERPDIPFWSENYYLAGFDAERTVAFAFHLGNWSLDGALRREKVEVLLPDGTFAVSVQVGKRDAENGVAGPALVFTCREPGVSWNYRYRGPVRRTTREEAYSGEALTAKPLELLDVDLTFEAIAPIWDFGQMKSSWAAGHIEQSGRIRGSITYGDGVVVKVDGYAQRDHSRGPRDYTDVDEVIWSQGYFPGGRSYAIVQNRMVGQENYNKNAVVIQDGVLHAATFSTVRPIADFGEKFEPAQFRIESDLGAMEVVMRVPRPGLPASYSARNEVLFGMDVIPGFTEMPYFVGPIEVEWNGVSGHGWADIGWSVRHPKTPE
jgi:hypothetical protein